LAIVRGIIEAHEGSIINRFLSEVNDAAVHVIPIDKES